ncbi:hypothetical protein IU452_19220 [Nocardia transvalensis]|nr:hypothetical protein [Nocardia transvalensis]
MHNHDIRLNFQRVANHQPSPWPDPVAPRRIRLDFSVDNLERTERHLLDLGAELATDQPGGQCFRLRSNHHQRPGPQTRSPRRDGLALLRTTSVAEGVEEVGFALEGEQE